MKLVLICEFFDEALEYQENLLAKYYALAGHDVTIITSTIRSIQDYYNDRDYGKGPGSDTQTSFGRLIRVPYRINLKHRIKIFESLGDLLSALEPDLLYFHDISPNLIDGVRHVKQHPECPMILDYHADATNSGSSWASRWILHGTIRRAFLSYARPHLRKIFPIVPAGIEFLHKYYGVPLDEMELLPLGTDQEFAQKVLDSDSRSRVRAALGLDDKSFLIFTGGKLTPLKRTECLLEAVNSLNDPNVHVVVAGSADVSLAAYNSQLEALSAANSNIHMLGWQDRTSIYEYMSASDLAIFPASQSVMWQQSMGMGLPLIVSERSEGQRGVQYVGYLNRHDNVIVLDPDAPTPAQIAGHIARLSKDRDALHAMAQGARQTAAEILDYRSICETTLRYCAEKPRP